MGSSSSRSSAARPRSSYGAAASVRVGGEEGARIRGDRWRFTFSSLLCGISFGDASAANQMEDMPVDEANILDVGDRSLHSAGILSSPQSSNLHGSSHFIDNLSCNFDAANSSSSQRQMTGNIFSASGSEDDSVSASTDSISEHNQSDIDETLVQNQGDEVTTATIQEPHPSPSSLSLSTEQRSVVDGNVHESDSLDPDLVTALRSMEPRDSAVLRVDVLSVSSGVLSNRDEEIHDSDMRSESLFWDAFLRRSSRRSGDFAAVLFAAEDVRRSNDRWLLDFDTSESSIHDEFRFLSRRHGTREQSQSSNLELLETFHNDSDERNTSLCVSGLHPDGTCSCDSLLIAEGLRAHASFSRIVVLAEALFEVLDEIHHHSVPFPLSMVSHPAPASVVDSFPIKIHKKLNVVEDADMCYICLAEYEDGDKVRVLPCRHQYHMFCVDKWLKEIQGVCPLCRRDVNQGVDISQ